MNKVCNQCGIEKSLDSYYICKERGIPRIRGVCKECEKEKGRRYRHGGSRPKWLDIQRRSNLKRKFGIDDVEYQRLLDHQNSGCAACGGQSIAGRRLAVDHDHSKKLGDPGYVRSLLCHHCNAALGHLNEDRKRLKQLDEYIVKYKINPAVNEVG